MSENTKRQSRNTLRPTPSRLALAAFEAIAASATINADDDPESWSIDLVISLMHFCSERHVDWNQVLYFAEKHFSDPKLCLELSSFEIGCFTPNAGDHQ
ncbi:MAG: hypothetical protein GY811_19890 [Myxococcales bacterium]|nr:hypothetical protein [Myxococcales bacterium]